MGRSLSSRPDGRRDSINLLSIRLKLSIHYKHLYKHINNKHDIYTCLILNMRLMHILFDINKCVDIYIYIYIYTCIQLYIYLLLLLSFS